MCLASLCSCTGGGGAVQSAPTLDTGRVEPIVEERHGSRRSDLNASLALAGGRSASQLELTVHVAVHVCRATASSREAALDCVDGGRPGRSEGHLDHLGGRSTHPGRHPGSRDRKLVEPPMRHGGPLRGLPQHHQPAGKHRRQCGVGDVRPVLPGGRRTQRVAFSRWNSGHRRDGSTDFNHPCRQLAWNSPLQVGRRDAERAGRVETHEIGPSPRAPTVIVVCRPQVCSIPRVR
mmetsp:Transcript_30480/g.79830  ORF Transcript_30480/g.79830 Transcript_30480/m.79830 type:complete len:234 (-) Transcript_30480:572-1273(-)